MASTPCESDEYGRVGRYLLGFGILGLTVLLSNVPYLIEHPEAVFGVSRPSATVLKLGLAGYLLQMAIGLWLSVSLVFEVARWRRVAAFLWPFTLALYFAPVPTARQDVSLAPALVVAALLMWELSKTLDRATREAD
jgi:hypothetical protein